MGTSPHTSFPMYQQFCFSCAVQVYIIHEIFLSIWRARLQDLACRVKYVISIELLRLAVDPCFLLSNILQPSHTDAALWPGQLIRNEIQS